MIVGMQFWKCIQNIGCSIEEDSNEEKLTRENKMTIISHDILWKCMTCDEDEDKDGIENENNKSNDEPILWNMNYRQIIWCLFGVLLVTFICPSLSTFALFQLPLGLMLTLTSLGPLYSLPLVYFLRNEKVSLLACMAAIVAVVGVILTISGS